MTFLLLTCLQLGVGPSRDLNDHIHDCLLLIGIERDIVEGRDRGAIHFSIATVVEGVLWGDLTSTELGGAFTVGHGGRGGLRASSEVPIDGSGTLRSYAGGGGVVEGRVEGFLGGSQGGVFWDLAVDEILRCRTKCRIHWQWCNDDASGLASWWVSDQHVPAMLLLLRIMYTS